jgi:hypothetical protein
VELFAAKFFRLNLKMPPLPGGMSLEEGIQKVERSSE